jgi:hypothetical protein
MYFHLRSNPNLLTWSGIGQSRAFLIVLNNIYMFNNAREKFQYMLVVNPASGMMRLTSQNEFSFKLIEMNKLMCDVLFLVLSAHHQHSLSYPLQKLLTSYFVTT